MIEAVSRARRHRGDQRGFTLIELLVVIVILGILAAVVVFAVRGVGDKGQSAAITQDERTLRTAQEAFCARNGFYAPSNEKLVEAGFLSEGSVLHDVVPGFGTCGSGVNGPTGFNVVCVNDQCPGSPIPPQDTLLLGASNNAYPSPFHYNRGGSYSEMFLMYDSLLWKDATGPIPWLATEVPTVANGLVTPDGLQYTFNLRPGVKWHDFATTGQILEASDVKFTFDYYKTQIAAGNIPGTVIAPPLSQISSVDVVDADTVRFNLSSPAATFLQFGAAGGVPIAPEHIWSTIPDVDAPGVANDVGKLVGTGPYRMDPTETFAAPTNFKFLANDDFFFGRPKVRVIQFDAAVGNVAGLNAGTVHMTGLQGKPSIVDPVRSQHSVLQAPPGSSTTQLNFNHAKAPFTDVRFRRAVAMTIDRQFLANQLFGDAGGPGNAVPGNPGWIPPGHDHYDGSAQQYPTNVSGANALLDGAGYPRGADGIRLYDNDGNGTPETRMEFPLNVGATASPFTPLLDSALNQVGIDLTEAIDANQNASINGGTVGMYLIGSGGLNSDLGADYLRLVYRTGATLIQRALNYSNPSLDTLLDAQLAEFDDEAARKAITADAQVAIADDVPLLPLIYPNSYTAYRADAFNAWFYSPGGVGGVVPTVLNKFAFVTGRQGGSPTP